jgi:hypothetical protein
MSKLNDRDALDVEDALVEVIRIFAARGRAIRQARERQGSQPSNYSGNELLNGEQSRGIPALHPQNIGNASEAIFPLPRDRYIQLETNRG